MDARGFLGNDINVEDNPDHYKAVSPIHCIPKSSDNQLPPILCAVGSDDTVVFPSDVEVFVAQLKEKGHQAQYWQHKGRGHCYLANSGWDNFYSVLRDFEKDGVPALQKMIEFLDIALIN